MPIRVDLPIEHVTRPLAELRQDVASMAHEDLERSDGYDAILTRVRKAIQSLGRPRYSPNLIPRESPPYSEDVDGAFRDIKADLELLHQEQVALASAIVRHFNHHQVAIGNLQEKVSQVRGEMNDLRVLSPGMRDAYTAVVEDRFDTLDRVDLLRTTAEVSDGIVTLKATGRTSRLSGARVAEITGKPDTSFPGNFGVVRPVENISPDPLAAVDPYSEVKVWDFLFSTESHADPSAILDGNPNTWFEWQLINVPEGAKKTPPARGYPDTKGYGWTWEDGTPIYDGTPGRDRLSVSLLIELPEERTANWLVYSPYIPESCDQPIIVEAAYVSRNGADWVPVGKGPWAITAETQIADPTMPGRENFRGKGVWVFPGQPVKFIRLDLAMEDPYDETVGHLYWIAEYDVVTTTRSHKKFLFITWDHKTETKTEHVVERIEGPRISRAPLMKAAQQGTLDVGLLGLVSGALAGAAYGSALGPVGTLLGAIAGLIVGLAGIIGGKVTEKDVSIQNLTYSQEPGIDVYEDGWRWMVGIRDIALDATTYREEDVLVSRPISFAWPIQTVALSVDEVIPEALYADDLQSRHEWITYYISVDDGAHWIRISPSEAQPVGDQVLPPKTIRFVQGRNVSPTAHQTIIRVEQPVRQIRFMARLRRGQDETITPILSGYQLRFVLEEVGQ